MNMGLESKQLCYQQAFALSVHLLVMSLMLWLVARQTRAEVMH